MIFQLSDWFPKPMIWTIIVKFDQIRKKWWRISCAEILEVGKNFFAASSVKKMSRFEEVSPEKIKRIAWKFTKTVILLGLAGYELIIERLSTAYFFPANDREGHVTWYFPRLPFAGRRFYSRRTFFPFGGNAKTWVFAAHFYCLFLHFDRLLL